MSKSVENNDLLEQQVEFRFLVSLGEGLPSDEKRLRQEAYWERVLYRLRKLNTDHPARHPRGVKQPRWRLLKDQLLEPVESYHLLWWTLRFAAKNADGLQPAEMDSLAAMCLEACESELPGDNNSVTPGPVVLTERRLITTVQFYKG